MRARLHTGARACVLKHRVDDGPVAAEHCRDQLRRLPRWHAATSPPRHADPLDGRRRHARDLPRDRRLKRERLCVGDGLGAATAHARDHGHCVVVWGAPDDDGEDKGFSARRLLRRR